MTDTLFALVPSFGAYLVALSVALSCLALPLPSSLLVLAAGGFAASGDLQFWHVGAGAFAGFVVGDQLAYQIGKRGGSALKTRLAKGERRAALVGKAEDFVDKRGGWAVLLSRTVVSPLGPYVGYLGAAAGMRWARFTLPAVIGAAIWSIGYAGLGYLFADRITDIADVISNVAGAIIALAILAGSGAFLGRAARMRHAVAHS